MYKRKLSIWIMLISIIVLLSCHQTIKKRETVNWVTTDTLDMLLEKAIYTDFLSYDNWTPFIFFKSGHFLNQSQKNALAVSCPDDSTYFIELYKLENEKWIRTDSVGNLYAKPIQFDPVFSDYNFDGQKDIYIQVFASNGYTLSYGHLLTVDPVNGKLEEHKEAFEFANMQPDSITKTIISENLINCKENGYREVCKQINQWNGSRLEKVRTDCPCMPD